MINDVSGTHEDDQRSGTPTGRVIGTHEEADKTIYLGWTYGQEYTDFIVIGAFPTEAAARAHPEVECVEPITMFGGSK